MFEALQWKDIYTHWESGCYDFPGALNASLTAETVFVEYNQGGYIYGYDWSIIRYSSLKDGEHPEADCSVRVCF